MNLKQYTREFKTNWVLASPVILGMLGHTFVGFVDNIMVGRLGTAELAAVSLGNSFMFVAMSLAIGFSTAITPLIAEADAKGKINNGKKILQQGLVNCIILSIILCGCLLMAEPLLYKLDQPVEVIHLAKPYLRIVAISLIPLISFQAFKQFSDGLSETKNPMFATLIGNILNIVFNYLFIFGHFGFPKLGIIGAAYGTLLSRILMVLVLWVLLSKNKKSKIYLVQFKWLFYNRFISKKITLLGIPSSLQMFFEVGLFTSAIWLSGLLGKNSQAANQIALNLSSMTFMVAMGLSVAAMVRVGNQKGLQAFVELRRITYSILLLAIILASGFALLFFVFHKWLPLIYLDINDPLNQIDNLEVISIASKLLIIAAFFQISDCIQVVALGALRGLQDVYIPTLITFISYWIIGFPVSFYLGKEEALGSQGIWIGLLVSLSCSSIFLLWRFYYLSKWLILQKQLD